MARIRVEPEDFQVEELPLYPPSGEGEHTFVRVEKRLRTTEEVAEALAHAAGVSGRDVGYAGRKDRVAVATQWLSVPGLAVDSALGLEIERVRVLEAIPHGHKLRTGQLLANRFKIHLREVDDAGCAAAELRVQELAKLGMPNHFGPQRFGHGERNIGYGLRLLGGRQVRPKDKRKARFAISALQAAVFNDVLDARRIAIGELEVGDVAMLHGSGGQFLVEDCAIDQPRADAFEISPTGPIFGTRVIEPAGEVALRERQALEARGVDLERMQVPRGIRLRGARRSFRVRPTGVSFEKSAEGFWLGFELPPGSYATVLLRNILGAPPEEGPKRVEGGEPRPSEERPVSGNADEERPVSGNADEERPVSGNADEERSESGYPIPVNSE
jgi:tRNA pseudouridine13 synthase